MRKKEGSDWVKGPRFLLPLLDQIDDGTADPARGYNEQRAFQHLNPISRDFNSYGTSGRGALWYNNQSDQ